jgi:hypothetical protein
MDTIKTLIAFRDFTIINPERFGGIAQVKRFEKANVYGNASMTCPAVITSKEKEQGYFPRIALVCNPFNINQSFTNLSIEFSIPKLLFNNNIEEVKNSDFQAVIERLREKLLILGVDVNEEILKKAYVQRIDYSKNFLIKSNIIEFLYNFTKIAIDPRLGGINRDYQRGGTGIKFYTKLYHIIVYDKIAEINKSLQYSDSRSLTKDNYSQREIVEMLKEKDIKLIRYEVSLKRKKMKKLLPIKDFTFENVFNTELAKQVLTKYIDTLHSGLRGINFNNDSIFSVADRIKLAFPTAKANKISSLTEYMRVITERGFDVLRKEYKMTSSQVSRLKKEIQKINEIPESRNNILEDIESIELSLKNFKALRFKNKQKQGE